MICPHVGEKDLRELNPDEDKLLRKASSNKDGVAVADLPEPVIQSLYKRHLIYVDVPVSGHQHFSTSSLEGFVSNRDMVAGDADPMESLLYEVFVSNSERLSVDALAQVLGRPAVQIQDAISTACRLGFAQLINSDGMIRLTFLLCEIPSLASFIQLFCTELASISFMHAEANMSQLGGGSSFSTTFGPEHSAIAVVLDAEATSYLMMGSLSPGMKRHSVTLFEGGQPTTVLWMMPGHSILH